MMICKQVQEDPLSSILCLKDTNKHDGLKDHRNPLNKCKPQHLVVLTPIITPVHAHLAWGAAGHLLPFACVEGVACHGVVPYLGVASSGRACLACLHTTQAGQMCYLLMKTTVAGEANPICAVQNMARLVHGIASMIRVVVVRKQV